MKRESRLGSGLIITSWAGRLSSAKGKLSAPEGESRDESGGSCEQSENLVKLALVSSRNSFPSSLFFCFLWFPFFTFVYFGFSTRLHRIRRFRLCSSLFDNRLGLCEAESPAPFPRLDCKCQEYLSFNGGLEFFLEYRDDRILVVLLSLLAFWVWGF